MTNSTITVPGPIWLRVTRRGRNGSLGVGTYKGTVHVVEEHDAGRPWPPSRGCHPPCNVA